MISVKAYIAHLWFMDTVNFISGAVSDLDSSSLSRVNKLVHLADSGLILVKVLA